MFTRESVATLKVPAGSRVSLREMPTTLPKTGEMKELEKKVLKRQAEILLERNRRELAEAQELLWAGDRYSVLIILQAMDAGGKDGTIKHVMTGVNPQGCRVWSFKEPSTMELDHTYLWRYVQVLPERGMIGIFNRSYYEDVTAARVHPGLLDRHKLPPGLRIDAAFWNQRYEDIAMLERYLVRNGVVILKFFLHISREEQKERFMERLTDPEKQWKFSASDLRGRRFWDAYMAAYEEAIGATSTEWAPWYVIPADRKWIARTAVATILTSTIRSLDLTFPPVDEEKKALLAQAQRELNAEGHPSR
ncbi:MAG: polyphosphate kinase 2 family protein [Methanomicrobiaceae archaeon]|nr:polyphosphate kinase 2 family protein [Methanomicrobiaceae archaeon]